MARKLRYLQIADQITEQITAGEIAPGELLSSESQLAEEHCVSRVTVRKALAHLRAQGIVDSRQGFGWYVLAAPLRQSLSELSTIEAQVSAAGLTPRRRILSFAFVDAPARAAAVLGVTTVLEITRLNLADDRPFARVTVWVPEPLAADLSRGAVERQPLYELLGIALGGATQSITAVGASTADAELLQLPFGSPLLRCERITSDTSGRAVLLSDAVFHPLVTEFVAESPALEHVEPTGLRLIR